jgi:hypothetical protein
MAGDWIKMRIALADDPAVISIAARLSVDEFEVVGMLHHLWGWADTQSRDGHAPGVTNVWIDRYVRHAGFAEAMVAVGWLGIDGTGVTFPRFDRHNGETAKTRALAAERKRNQRSKVTEEEEQMSRSERDISVTREEKRREEKKETNTKAPRAKRAPRPSKTPLPIDFSVSDRVRDWAAENGHSRLHEHFDSFVRKARAKGYEYASWDDAFMEAIRADWAGLQKQQGPPRALSWSEKNDEVIAQLTGRNRYEPDDRTIDI